MAREKSTPILFSGVYRLTGNHRKYISTFFLAALFLGVRGPLQAAEPEPAESFFAGPDCKACHGFIREKEPALAGEYSKGASEYDVIVVGGGLSGLTAAYSLKDKRVLVLEKESTAGGKVRRENWGSQKYPAGAVSHSEPYGPFLALFKELGLNPQRIHAPAHSLFLGGGFIPDFLREGFERLPYPREDKDGFAKLSGAAAAFLADAKNTMPPVPGSLSKEQGELDKTSFHDHLLEKYGAEVARFGDLYSKSAFGVGSKEVSALAGWVLLSGEYAPTVSWNGGPGAITAGLTAKLRSRIRSGAFVSAVKAGKDGVIVAFESANGRQFLHARTVIMAVPSYVSKNIILDLPKRRRKAFDEVRYSAYAVAAVALNKRFNRPSFKIWSYDTVFSDILFPDWIAERGIKGLRPPEQVLLARIPLEMFRAKLYADDPVLKTQVTTNLESLFPGIGKEILGVRLVRWGHAHSIPFPGYLSDLRPELAKPLDRIFFAGADTELPAIEGAMAAGLRAAAEARQKLGN